MPYLVNHGARADGAALADLYARLDDNVAANEDVLANVHILALLARLVATPPRRIDAHRASVDAYIRPDDAAVADRNSARVDDRAVGLDLDVVAD